MLVTYSPAAVPGGRPQYKEHDVFGNLQLHVTAILGEEPLLKQLRRPQGARARNMPSLGITLVHNLPLLLAREFFPLFKVVNSCP